MKPPSPATPENDDLGRRQVSGHDVDNLLPAVYDELHGLAEAVLQHNRVIGGTCATSLINDVYLRLTARGVQFNDHNHFLCLAARAMRFVLIDRVRKTQALKRGGGKAELILEHDAIAPAVDGPTLLAIDEALSRLAQFDDRKSRVVELRFFGGLSVDEIAQATGSSPATVKREWTMARAWLYRELGGAEPAHE